MLKPFGETLRRLRIEKGLSQQQLANMLHVERSSFSNWEAGRRLPDTAMIFQIATALAMDSLLVFICQQNSSCGNRHAPNFHIPISSGLHNECADFPYNASP